MKMNYLTIKRIIFLIIFFVSTTALTFAQEKYQHAVYLKNGGIIRGKIIEQIPAESLKIETVGKNVFVFQIDEIENIIVEAIVTDPDKVYNINYTKKTTYPKRKEPAIAFLCSAIIPGLGQFYNDDIKKGAWFFVSYSITAGIGTSILIESGDPSLFLFAGVIIYFWAALDAPISANRINQRNGLALNNGTYLNILPDIKKDYNLADTDGKFFNSYGMKLCLSF